MDMDMDNVIDFLSTEQYETIPNSTNNQNTAIYDVGFEDSNEFNEWINFEDNNIDNDNNNDNNNCNVHVDKVNKKYLKFIVDDELLGIFDDYNNSVPLPYNEYNITNSTMKPNVSNVHDNKYKINKSIKKNHSTIIIIILNQFQ
mgnify:CR=1 FL=1